jgi:hypothetical protein
MCRQILLELHNTKFKQSPFFTSRVPTCGKVKRKTWPKQRVFAQLSFPLSAKNVSFLSVGCVTEASLFRYTIN